MISISQLIEFYRTNDFKQQTQTTRINTKMGTVWINDPTDRFLIKVSVHEKSSEVNLYHLQESNNMRILYDSNDVNLRITSLNSTEKVGSTILIQNASELRDEAVFFQQSTMNDYADLSHEDLVFMLDLFPVVIEYAKGQINANKTPDSTNE